jgi:hypothetical protein
MVVQYVLHETAIVITGPAPPASESLLLALELEQPQSAEIPSTKRVPNRKAVFMCGVIRPREPRVSLSTIPPWKNSLLAPSHRAASRAPQLRAMKQRSPEELASPRSRERLRCWVYA